MDAPGLHTVHLSGPDDVGGAMRALGRLLAAGTAPEAVLWLAGEPAQPALFGAPPGDADGALAADTPAAVDRSAPALPAPLQALARDVLLHDDPARFQRLHRLAARVHADPRVLADTLHPERLRLERMAREVRREVHKMHAFVRFRPVREADGSERHVAWFEPGHHVVRAAAPFFQRRFAAMHWAILTPRGSVAWDREQLVFGPPARREDAPPADAGEALWLAYYRSIFNPARTKPAMMRREMPVRFWRNLPEAVAIAPLLREAAPRVAAMAALTGDTARRLPARPGVAAPAAAPGAPSDRPVAGAAPDRPSDDGEPRHEPPPTPDLRALWRRLAAQAASCARCPVSEGGAPVVWGRGALPATVALVGEQPGDAEDRAGRPFVGPAGQLLQRALDELGWPLRSLYATNAVKHFHHTLQQTPRGPRRIHKTPAQQAVAACLDWLEAELALARPQAVVALGATAARALLGEAAPPASDGAVVARADGLPVLVVAHPAALLRRGVAPGSAGWQQWLAQLSVLDGLFVDTEPVLPAHGN